MEQSAESRAFVRHAPDTYFQFPFTFQRTLPHCFCLRHYAPINLITNTHTCPFLPRTSFPPRYRHTARLSTLLTCQSFALDDPNRSYRNLCYLQTKTTTPGMATFGIYPTFRSPAYCLPDANGCQHSSALFGRVGSHFVPHVFGAAHAGPICPYFAGFFRAHCA